MKINSDFKDLLRSLNAAGTRYLIVGGYAVMVHTEPRYTKDFDIFFGLEAASDAKLAFRPELTGQPNLIGQSQPVRHQGFVRIPVRASLKAIENPNAACRAFRPAAAGMGARHARSESRLEQGLIGGHVKIDLVR
jgi:hypothetical protein